MQVSAKTIFFTAIFLVTLYGLNFLYALQKGAEGGTFGDTFGAVNALFSGLALFFWF